MNAALKLFSDTKMLKRGVLEIVFEGEEGSGLGPTLEFYNIVCDEILKLPI